MSRWIAYRRTNEMDEPKPEVIAHEWIVTTDPYRQRLQTVFPDTYAGQSAAALCSKRTKAAARRRAMR